MNIYQKDFVKEVAHFILFFLWAVGTYVCVAAGVWYENATLLFAGICFSSVPFFYCFIDTYVELGKKK